MRELAKDVVVLNEQNSDTFFLTTSLLVLKWIPYVEVMHTFGI